jgi:hypothetical protein
VRIIRFRVKSHRAQAAAIAGPASVGQMGFGAKHMGWRIDALIERPAVIEVSFAVARSVGHIRAASAYGCEFYGKPLRPGN